MQLECETSRIGLKFDRSVAADVTSITAAFFQSLRYSDKIDIYSTIHKLVSILRMIDKTLVGTNGFLDPITE